MIASPYEESLEYLKESYNAFLNQAVLYLKECPSSSKSLANMLKVWIHPKGISNLINTLTLQIPSKTTNILLYP